MPILIAEADCGRNAAPKNTSWHQNWLESTEVRMLLSGHGSPSSHTFLVEPRLTHRRKWSLMKSGRLSVLAAATAAVLLVAGGRTHAQSTTANTTPPPASA